MAMQGLMLHTGGYAVTREDIDNVRTPDRTNSFVPIAHSHLIDLVSKSVKAMGLTIKSEAHGLAHDGQRYFGLLGLAGNDGADHELVVGLRNSHDHAFRASLAMGSNVFVCDNLSFMGDVTVGRKHTSRIQFDLPRLVAGAVGLLNDLRHKQAKRFEIYKQTEISNAVANDILIQAVRTDVLVPTKLKTAIAEWDAPRYKEFAEGGPTLWRLFNAITEAIKGRVEPLRLQTPAIHGIFDQAAGFEMKKLTAEQIDNATIAG
jgi:hypothetical protein